METADKNANSSFISRIETEFINAKRLKSQMETAHKNAKRLKIANGNGT